MGKTAPVSTVTRGNVERVLELFNPADRAIISLADSEDGTVFLEWRTVRGYVALELGTRSYNLTYVPGDSGGNAWESNGSLTRLEDLAGKLSLVKPVDKNGRPVVCRVVLFTAEGRFYAEESWKVPKMATGPWDMRDSNDYHRVDDGFIFVDAEGWGFSHLLLP